MRNAKEYYRERQIQRQLNIPTIGIDISEIVKSRTTAEEQERILASKQDALFGRPLYHLKDIKQRFSLSWNELRRIVMNF